MSEFFSVLSVILLTGLDWRDPEPFASIRKDYIAAAERLEAGTKTIECQTDYRISGLNGDIQFDEDIVVKEDSTQIVIKYRVLRGKKLAQTMVLCRTPSYGFQLARDSVGPYILNSINSADKLSTSFNAGILINSAYFTEACFAIDHHRVRDILEKAATTQVTDLPAQVAGTTDQGASPALMRIEFSCEGKDYWLKRGVLTLDRSLDWALREYDVELNPKYPGQERLPEGSRTKASIRAKNWPGIGIFPTEVEYANIYPHGQDKRNIVIRSIKHPSPNEAVFKLSNFGLPDSILEPRPTQNSATMVSLFFGLGGLSLLIATIVLRKLAGRLRAAPTS